MVFVIVALLILSIPFFTRTLVRPETGIIDHDPQLAVDGVRE
jgi:hypothetical protein